MKRFHWFEVTLVVVILGMHLYAAFSAPHNFSTHWFIRDDAFYYYKVAQNIAEGHGSTFDGINPTNGYHPLWLLICIPIFALARFDLILPLRIVLLVMALVSAATSVLIFRLLRRVVTEPIAMLAASFWGLSTLIHSIVTQPGMETGITALSIVALLCLMQRLDQKWRGQELTRSDIAFLALAAIFVIFSRLDSIYLALLAGVWIIFRRTPVRYLLPFDLLATFAVIVLAYIQRAELKIYLLVFPDSAILTAAVTFTIQTIVFYLAGLYRHPKERSMLLLLRDILIGTAASAALAGAVMLAVSAAGLADFPRAIPFIYWAGIALTTLVSRLALRFVSPAYPASEEGRAESPVSLFRQRWKTWLAEGTLYYGLLGLALGVYMLVNKFMFGTLLPVSGQVKRWWGSLPDNVYGGGAKTVLDIFALDPATSQAWSLFTDPLRGLLALLKTNRFWSHDRLYWTAIAILAVLWLILFLLNRRRNLGRVFRTALVPLLISAELQAFLYGAMAYAGEQEWYWSMQMIALLILGALTLGNLLELLPRRSRVVSGLAWAGAGLASLYLAWLFTTSIYERMPYQDTLAGQPYMDMLPIIEANTEPGALIGMTGGGNAGYFIKDRTIINMDGLINSNAYFQALQDGQAGQYLRKMGVRYVFGSYYILTESMPYRANLAGQLERIPGTPAYGNKEILRLIAKP